MSVFGSIASAIFGKGKTPGATPLAPGAPAPQGTATVGGAPATGKAMTETEVEGMIKKIADGQSEKLNWQQSIVDLMKLLKLDSSLTARKQLAQELGYKGARRLGRDEYLAAQRGHDQACRKRRCRPGEPQARLRGHSPG